MKESQNIIINESSENSNEKKEHQNSIIKQKNICQICSKKYSKDPNIKCIIFNNCEHEICYICLYKILIRSHIKSISQIFSSDNKLKLNCICGLGSKDISIQEIISILKSLNKNIKDIKPEKLDNFTPCEKKCEIHDIPISKFCLECYEPICEECIDDHTKKRKTSIHCNHKTTSYKEFYMKIYNDLEQIPNLNIILSGKRNFEENFLEKYSDLINIKFENLINEIIYIKEKILKNIKEEYEKYNLSMEAINLIYKYYYYELISINNETDINQLMFLYNTNISLPELNYKFSKAEKILNEALKKLNESNLENLFEFKFNPIKAKPYKCIQIIPQTHSTNITSICNLYNNRFASGDFDGNIKIWKKIYKKYILIQSINKIYQGVINQICKIKLNKFAICSQSSPFIKIFQENINTEKFNLIQEIKLNESSLNEESSEIQKYFHKISTLNDGITIIAATNDNYIYIFQDKIGGIPKQNYMKTNYELVEYFEAFHSKDINSILHTKTENIITASEDCTIKVWNKERKYSTLIGHEDSVNVIEEIDKRYIVSGGSDCLIILWELLDMELNDNKYILKQKLIGHEFSVIGLAYLNNDRLISASIDDTIKIWQRNKYEMFINKITIKEKKLGIEGLVNINNDTLITFSGNKSIQIWEMITDENLINIKNKTIFERIDLDINKKDIAKRTMSVDYIVKNSIKEFVEKEIIVEDIKNENFEISTKSDQNKI